MQFDGSRNIHENRLSLNERSRSNDIQTRCKTFVDKIPRAAHNSPSILKIISILFPNQRSKDPTQVYIKKIKQAQQQTSRLQHSTMLDMYLLTRVRIINTVLPSTIGIQAQVARHQASLSGVTRLGVNDAIAALRSLHELGVLLLENGEVALSFPVPDGVGGEDEVHFLEGTLVGFRVEGPDDDDGGGVDGAEEIEGLFVEFGEDGGEEEHLGCAVSGM